MVEQYQNWTAVSQAMKSVAQTEYRNGASSHDVAARLVEARLDRFLCRVFAEDERSEWLLKGGSALLARVSDARPTKDLDLLASSSRDLDEAVRLLVEIGKRDLGDHLRFDLVDQFQGHAGNQREIQLRGLVFVAVDRGNEKRLGRVPIDVVVGPAPVGTVDLVEPSNRLLLPRPLAAVPYRLFPLADHVADKVVATMSRYQDDRESTRVKDLVDLVAIATTQRVDFAELRLAVQTKMRLARIEAVHLTVPASWRNIYPTRAAGTVLARAHSDFDSAVVLAREFVDPALSDEAVSGPSAWIPGSGWTTTTTSADARANRARTAFAVPATPSPAHSADRRSDSPPASPEHTEDRGR